MSYIVISDMSTKLVPSVQMAWLVGASPPRKTSIPAVPKFGTYIPSPAIANPCPPPKVVPPYAVLLALPQLIS